MEVISNQPSGIQTAWLLATLGSKVSSRNKIIKKDNILNISIPNICKEVINQFEQQQPQEQPIQPVNKNIKYASNILYGLSILYKSKISYILNDLNYIQLKLLNNLKLNKQVVTNSIITNSINNSKTGGLKRSRFFENDESFDIKIDFLPNLNLDETIPQIITNVSENQQHVSPSKRRKIEIARFDQLDFPIFNQSTTTLNSTTTNATTTTNTALTFALSLSEQENREVDNFLNSPIELNQIDDDEILNGRNLNENNDELSNIQFNINDELQIDERRRRRRNNHELDVIEEYLNENEENQQIDASQSQRRSLIDNNEFDNDVMDMNMDVDFENHEEENDQRQPQHQGDDGESDESFHVISGEATQSQRQQQQGQQQQQQRRNNQETTTTTRISSLTNRRLIIDDPISLPTSTIIENNRDYQTNMIQLRNQSIQIDHQPINRIEEINQLFNQSLTLNNRSISDHFSQQSRIQEINQLTESMANEESEQARNIEFLQIEQSRIFNENDDENQRDIDMDFGDNQEQQNEEIPHPDLNFDENLQDLEFELRKSSPNQSQQDLLMSNNESINNSQNHKRLKNFINYFMEKSIELNTFTTTNEEESTNSKQYKLNFNQLVPPPSSSSQPNTNPINNKKIAIHSFSTILILLNKTILNVDIKNQNLENSETKKFELLKPENIELTLKINDDEDESSDESRDENRDENREENGGGEDTRESIEGRRQVSREESRGERRSSDQQSDSSFEINSRQLISD
ncbi:uncharacterized protein KGF55_000842 [Candida pseudojiufengensis]|uniref:uncharacterized protein n=1 Tax=Candida pseudojiufengensis TaxID=497109 RepID=UPI00222497C8|nr:uncharacterized protein KGF55_000842 [Candida pseudojiufengensis]KAI5966533.1 hypothetical protein KGF55_000842 [Candida pseudojiufengensis]